MNVNKYKTLFKLAFLSVLVIAGCKNEPETNDPQPSAQKASNLVYSPNSLNVTAGQSVSSATPTVDGTSPFTYSLTTTPTNDEITIDANSGVITVSAQSAAGTFNANVTVSNSAGESSFSNALSIVVSAPSSSTTFVDVLPIIQSSCAPCHIAGGSNTDYSVYSNAKNNISSIINRIKRAQGTPGFMPRNGSKLSDADIALIEKWQTDGLLEN